MYLSGGHGIWQHSCEYNYENTIKEMTTIFKIIIFNSFFFSCFYYGFMMVIFFDPSK